MRLTGRRALITGAASGIGKAVVSSFLKEGAEVVAADIAYPGAAETGEGGVEVHLDVAAESQRERLIERAGRICQGGGGTIVLVGSASGIRAAAPASAYCASKAALRMLVKAAALELKPENIRVNCVSPAGVVTPMWRGMPFWRGLVESHGGERRSHRLPQLRSVLPHNRRGRRRRRRVHGLAKPAQSAPTNVHLRIA